MTNTCRTQQQRRLPSGRLLLLCAAFSIASQGVAQETKGDYSFITTQDAWLSSSNAAPLTRVSFPAIADARLSLSWGKGELVNYNESPDALEAQGCVEAFQRMSKRTVVFGRIAYDNFSGRRMGGSAFISPDRLPFNIVEDSLTNLGRKHRDTYELEGAIGTQLWRNLAAGARVTYKAANIAKYKDLRHKNKLMDLTATAGLYIPLGAFQAGVDYQYHRSTESIVFSTYGVSDKTYQSLVSYAAFTGRVEQFGSAGFTDPSREMPLLSSSHGAGLQLGLTVGSLTFFNDATAHWQSGYYGRKSPYTITYTEHSGRRASDEFSVTLKKPEQLHRLSLSVSAEETENRLNNFLEVSGEGGATHYDYFTPTKSGDKQWRDISLSYVVHLHILADRPAWTLRAAYSHHRRRETAYVYPYLRRQHLGIDKWTLSARHNLTGRQGFYSIGLETSFGKGHGQPFSDGLLATPSDQQTVPAMMTDYLLREHHYLTAPHYAFRLSCRYTFALPVAAPYVEATIDHRKANGAHPAGLGRDHTTMQIAAGCTF